jgi:hypothetical protein
VKRIVVYLWNEAFIAALLAVVLCSLLLRNGVLLSPDGWAYWEGSVSLLHGRGYDYFGGHPIYYYPPLFSLYLALWQAVFGASGGTICLALIVTCGATAFVWTYLFRLLFGEHRARLQSVLLVVFVPSFLVVCYGLLLSETLQLLLQGLLLLAMTMALLRDQRPAGWSYWKLNLWLGLLFFLLLVCRNSSLAFLPAVGMVLLALLWREWKVCGMGEWSLLWRGAVSFFVVLVGPVAAWHGIRKELQQLTSHQIKPFQGTFTPDQYAWQIVESSIFFLGPDGLGQALLLGLLGFLLYAVLLRGEPQSKVARFMLLFVASSIVILYLIFNMTFVADPFKGRYLWFVPLMLVGTAIALTTLIRPGRWRPWLIGFLAVVVAMQVLRVTCFAASTLDREQALPIPRVEFIDDDFYNMYALLRGWPADRIEADFTLHPDHYYYGGGFPDHSRQVENGILVCPPHFVWYDRDYDKKRKQE